MASHHNDLKASILDYLQDHSGVTKKKVAEFTDYSIPTVTKAVEKLLQQGLIRKRGLKDTSVGRKPSIYEFEGSNYFLIGIDLSIPKFNIALFDLSKRLVASKSSFLNMEKVQKDSCPDISSELIEGIKSLVNREKVPFSKLKAIGLGAPGIVREGSFKPFTRFDTDEMVPLQTPIQNEFEIPVFVKNDVDSELLSLLDEEDLLDIPDLVAVYLAVRSSGGYQSRVNIGGSIYHNGNILQGKNGSAGEFGHTSVDISSEDKFTPCKCGNNICLDKFVNSKIENYSESEKAVEEITQRLNQKIADLFFLFNPTLLVIDMEAFPEIKSNLIQRAKTFSSELAKELCIKEISIETVENSSMACARGSIITQLNEMLCEPQSYDKFFSD
ncbi:ROK family transcriptional regulator [Candidatus Bipolaricaulota bacterium]|nr:ROK family transcriptional regulator [Candidatus Bipolaricaulota bacterium]